MPIDHQRSRTQERSIPDALAFDLRIECKGGCGGCGQPQIERVTEFVSGEAQSQVDRLLARRALSRMLAASDRTGEVLRPRPQRRLQAAFASERCHDAILRN